MQEFTTLVASKVAGPKLTMLPVMIDRGHVFGQANQNPEADFAAYQFVLSDNSENVTYWIDISSRTGRVIFVHVTHGLDDLGTYGGSGGRLNEDEFVGRFVHLYSELSRAIVRPTLSDSEVLKISLEGGE